MTGYYDYVLGLIPAALFGVTVLLNLVGLPFTLALPVGASIALGIMAHAMFVRNPLPGADGSTPSMDSGSHGSRTASGGSD
ncbi:hypothetical protein J2751_000156 [Halorubrum alkaliphilum]|uniref:Uncharacterized protein n=1 Tax=Halorubrum alkaliphilum TaxID=261290 RepID=A0A8T4GAQ6_9EURY|nr:hypothetical protein [Halorubrum alkaliphilum]MBP1921173.1 hypothetical protein [Halorubrum alkaliphilum]